ncbi:hypothetical protein GCM10007414_29330 [Agarivorans gilvus]|uniref:Uncharacterized protein n=1 Tax=Agarivorans gilvus TaxID=680279 RepID=A0ABQ1I3V9_9ALTE|nr:hypothetical protein GCM10007414_29330 [Agarivorans gilvus]
MRGAGCDNYEALVKAKYDCSNGGAGDFAATYYGSHDWFKG